MRINIIIFFIIISGNSTVVSQSIKFNWLDHIHGVSPFSMYPYEEFVQSKNSNLITAGVFHGNLDFDPSPASFYLNTTGNYNDFYVLALDSSGTFLWVNQITGANHEYARDVTTDDSNYIYVTGNYVYTGFIDFDPSIDTLQLIANGQSDIFVEKFDANGGFEWAFNIGGIGNESANSIITDLNGNFYITGWFTDSMDFDPGPGFETIDPIGSANCFIAKYAKNGQFIWVKSILGSGNVWGSKIITDQNGYVYTLGNLATTGMIDFDTGLDTLYYTGSGSFLHKMDSSGNFIWAKVINYPYSGSSEQSICMDNQGNFYISDNFNGTGDFDPGPSQYSVSTTSSSSPESFILKLNSLGEFNWLRINRGNGFTGSDIKGIAYDYQDGIYACGYYVGYCDMDPGTNSSVFIDSTGTNGFILKIDTSSNFEWAKEYQGSFTLPNNIIVDSMKNVYVFGHFDDSTDFDLGIMDSTLHSVSTDIFIQKFNSCTPSTVIDSIYACNTYEWINGITYTNDNFTDYYIEENACGCDSIIRLKLNLHSVNLDSVFVTDSIIYSLNTNASFQWLICDSNYLILPEQTLDFIVADNNINYAVEITQNGCVDTSDCYHISLANVNELYQEVISVYPNPARDNFTIEISDISQSEINGMVELYDIYGRLILQSSTKNNNKFKISTMNLSNGMYLISYISNTKSKLSEKLVIYK